MILYFLKMCPIFVGSVHNFGGSDNDMIYVVLCPSNRENLEWYLLEVLPYNHCLYDNLNRFNFIVPLDIDEIIFPIMVVVHLLLGCIFFSMV